jgi:hypothetical protein
VVGVHETFLIDYQRERCRTALESGKLEDWNYVPPFVEFPEWVVPLTNGENHGDYLLLDTSDGNVTLSSLYTVPFCSSDSQDLQAL